MEATNGKETGNACEIPNRIGKNNIINYGSLQRPRPVTAWSVSMDLPSTGDAVVRELLPPGPPRPLCAPRRPAGRPGPGPLRRLGAQCCGNRQASSRDAPSPSSRPAQHRHCSRGPRRSTQQWPGHSSPLGARPADTTAERRGKVWVVPAPLAALARAWWPVSRDHAKVDICMKARGGGEWAHPPGWASPPGPGASREKSRVKASVGAAAGDSEPKAETPPRAQPRLTLPFVFLQSRCAVTPCIIRAVKIKGAPTLFRNCSSCPPTLINPTYCFVFVLFCWQQVNHSS